MAFAAARMIKDKKDQAEKDLKQKRSMECISNAAKQRSKVNFWYRLNKKKVSMSSTHCPASLGVIEVKLEQVCLKEET